MAAEDSPRINMPGTMPANIAAPAKERKRRRKEIAPATQPQASTPQPPISINAPATGYEQFRAEQMASFGGTRFSGRGSNYRERINKGPYKNRTPQEAEVLMQQAYGKLSEADKDAATSRAKGEHIRTPAEKAALEQYDQGMSRLMFGDQAGGATGAAPQPASPESPAAAPQPKPGAAERFRTAARAQMAGMSSETKVSLTAAGLPLVNRSGSAATTVPRVNTPSAPGSLDVVRNASGKETAKKREMADATKKYFSPDALKTAEALQSSKPESPSRPSFDRAAATAKAQAEETARREKYAATKQEAVAKASATQVKAPPIPEPSPAMRGAAKEFAAQESKRPDKGYQPRSFLQSPQYAAAQKADASGSSIASTGRPGGRNAPPPTVSQMVAKVTPKQSQVPEGRQFGQIPRNITPKINAPMTAAQSTDPKRTARKS